MSKKVTILTAAILLCGLGARADDLERWTEQFHYSHDFTLRETAGLRREEEPVEITLSVREGEIRDWRKEARIYRLDEGERPRPVPFQVYGRLRSNLPESCDPSTESVNLVFPADCDPLDQAVYRVLWCAVSDEIDAPRAGARTVLGSKGAGAGATVSNRFYNVRLSPVSGGILEAGLAGQGEERPIRFYQKDVPIHFAVDVWSPPEAWDHDYDWKEPPNEKWVSGPMTIKYHRWGPLSRYKDVNALLSYTFYANVPWMRVSVMLEFTENRSVRAVRIGEIVTTHIEREGRRKRDEPLQPVFTHYAWSSSDGGFEVMDIEQNMNGEAMAEVAGYAKGSLEILDRDVPWIAGFSSGKGYGMASLRDSQTVINRYGNPLPSTASCTYLAQYGWGFTYWSRAGVYPFGANGDGMKQDTVVSKGTVFTAEEALLVFEPTANLGEVRDAYRRLKSPLQLQHRGSGPW